MKFYKRFQISFFIFFKKSQLLTDKIYKQKNKYNCDVKKKIKFARKATTVKK